METEQKEKLSILIKRRGTIKGKITRMTNYINNFNKETDDLNEIKARSTDLQKVMEDYENVQSSIEEYATASDREYEEERSSVETKYYSLKSSMERLLDSPISNSSQHSNKNYYMSSPLVKLPQLELPTFHGELKEWPTFKNLFTCAVDRSNIPTLQKFQYLKTALKGEAAGLVSSLLISEENYSKALEILTTSLLTISTSAQGNDVTFAMADITQ
ncbi:uncharacterized protein isoform X2 [Choristoneura fumiferana]|uniref:uncharacterized protein isoform X2 n=1 Tax=Choristoneura fumiferana TaxID=7141 RepID=UPI003D15481A